VFNVPVAYTELCRVLRVLWISLRLNM